MASFRVDFEQCGYCVLYYTGNVGTRSAPYLHIVVTGYIRLSSVVDGNLRI